jgi:Arc/MetJ family transcription regulator
MTRTNIDIDDELIAEIMTTYQLPTKREAVDFALRRARRRRPLTVEEILALRGIGWEGDLEAIKTGRIFDHEGEPVAR